VTVFCRWQPPRHNAGGWPVAAGFASEGARDAAMTAASTEDVAWVRPFDEAREAALRASLGAKYRPGRVSGTARNLLRRAAAPPRAPSPA
jgi:hypothetical protein